MMTYFVTLTGVLK